MRWRLVAVLLVCAAAGLPACRRAKPPPDASATTGASLPATVAPPQPTTTTIDVSAPPTPAQLHDPTYWNAVLATLNHVIGNAFRSAVATGKVEPSATESLQQVYGPNVLPGQVGSLSEVIGGKRTGVVIPPGDPVATVTSIVRAEPRCVGLVASLNYQKVNSTVPTAQNVMRLLPRAATSQTNPTPWMIDEFYILASPDDSGRMCPD